ncbi:MAG: succinate dehydrogenase, hydrophobic membrane anchor protein [Woeseia sp.]
MTDRRTPLARVLGTGSAKDGTGHWWSQRITAVALLVVGVWFLLSVALLPGPGYGEVRGWIGTPWTAVLMLILILSTAYHSDLGIQVVIQDYVHQPFLKIASIVVARFLHVLLAAASIFAVLRIAFAAGS